MLGTLNSRQIDQVLRSEVVGHLGCYLDGKVYLTPISYATTASASMVMPPMV
jgi:nitroimidazol reductase NimA-like FMN-containing flavoprotein (pyridoxamine 5'-phosphate oxidase superfamily)